MSFLPFRGWHLEVQTLQFLVTESLSWAYTTWNLTSIPILYHREGEDLSFGKAFHPDERKLLVDWSPVFLAISPFGMFLGLAFLLRSWCPDIQCIYERMSEMTDQYMSWKSSTAEWVESLNISIYWSSCTKLLCCTKLLERLARSVRYATPTISMKYDTPAAEKALSKPCETKGPSTLIFLFTRCPFERNIW